MLLDNVIHPAKSGIGDLFVDQSKPIVVPRAAEMLQSNIIIGFERALEHGMRPMEALSVIIGWVSSEMARISMEPEPVAFERANG